MDKMSLLFHIDKIIMDLSGFFINLIRLPAFLSSFSFLKKNKILHRNSDVCYILGLGPSLAAVDLSKIRGDIIVTNRFYQFSQSSKISPTFYCINDGDFFSGKESHDFQQAVSRYPNTQFLLNIKFLKQIKKLCPNSNNLYFSYSSSGVYRNQKKIDFSKRLPVFFNVIGYALALSIYLGYKKIYLLGCDFNSFASQKAIHCYPENSSRKWKMFYELFCYSFAAEMHDQFQKYAEKHNIVIHNATLGSLIDAYPRDNEVIKELSLSSHSEV